MEQQQRSGLMARVIGKFGGTSAGTGGLPRRRAVFTMDPAACEPGIFDAPFEVTLVALSPEVELRCYAESNGNPMVAAVLFGRHSIEKVDGDVLTAGEDQVFWDALGPGGRQVVTAMYARAFVSDAVTEATGKALASLAQS